ncbi:hypothetical protein [Rhizobium sp. 2MFCol3.1]|uniref:hypothetical protein n=1 Tax=Rhizobium sp. 2MFCol3.1 TaxID=1246459 RepID=UPI000366C08A|nr:hypothetical protein [Rhizobium sp. 2MFCol3.1]
MAKYFLKPTTYAPVLDDDEVGEDATDVIREWFFENFEAPEKDDPDPWRFGGPFDAREEIDDNFFGVNDEIVDDIVDELELEAPEWAPHADRVVDVEVLELDLRVKVSELRELVARLPTSPPGIGGNQPPEDIGLPPYDETGRHEIQEALRILDIPVEEMPTATKQVVEAAERLRSRGQQIAHFFARHGDRFAESFADQLGKRVADSITAATWLKFAGLLAAVYEVAKALFIKIGIPWPI